MSLDDMARKIISTVKLFLSHTYLFGGIIMRFTPGKTFHWFRVDNRHFSATATAEGLINTSTLHRFESDTTSPYLIDVLPLLDRLRIDPSEFFSREQGFNHTQVARFFQSISSAYENRDVSALLRLQKFFESPATHEAALPYRHLDAIVVNAALAMMHDKPLPDTDVAFAMAYFHQQPNWLSYDLHVLRWLPSFLSKEDLIWVAQNLYLRALTFIESLDNANSVGNISLDVATQLIISLPADHTAAYLLRLSGDVTALQKKMQFSIHRKVLEAAIAFNQGETIQAQIILHRVYDALDLFDSEWDERMVSATWPKLIHAVS
ncbi:hypothetical protein [Schleiferilactobacillus shenzhenensis]|uniref:hypothetical protein n=1 Tax=Schleiferilactobacillus shenzhenensis TaxID=1231337 RepID=UPI0012DE43C4|nr:hypothetical protein [Schleiferilactobacillus shenzhenensis]